MLLEAVIAGLRRPHAFVRRAVEGLDRVAMTAAPDGAPPHAAWTLGHLIVSCQAIGEEIDLPHWLEESFRALFATGSRPVPDPAAYPGRDDLLARLADAEARVVSAIERLGVAGLARPLPDVRYRALLPTSGHAVVYACCNHATYHAGLLAAWRRRIDVPFASDFAP